MNNWCVYRHMGPDGWCYVGITSGVPELRWRDGLGYQGSNWQFFKYILSVGWNNIKHEILYSGLSESEARRLEKKEILKAGERVFNIQCGPKGVRFVPTGKVFKYDGLSVLEQYAVDLWADSLFGEITSETRKLIMEHYGDGCGRSIMEFESGDEVRILREMEYIGKRKLPDKTVV